jgi:hypothetical protein
MTGCRSPQEDSAVHHVCRPFEKRSGTRVPARSRTSSTGTHEGSIGAGHRRERLALQKTEVRVRSCGLRRKWRGAGRHVRTGVIGHGLEQSPGIGGLLHYGSETSLREVRWRDCTRAGLRCQRPPGDPCARCRVRMSPMQARPALLSRPLCEDTAAQRPLCTACCRILLCQIVSSGSPLNTVGCILPRHHGQGETADAVWDVERPGARPVRRAPWLRVEGKSIVYRICVRGPIITGSTARRAPDTDRRADLTPLCRLGGR